MEYSLDDHTLIIWVPHGLNNVLLKKQGNGLMDLGFPVLHSSIPQFHHIFILFSARLSTLAHLEQNGNNNLKLLIK